MNDNIAKKAYSRFGLTYTIGQLGYGFLIILISFIIGRLSPGILSSLNSNLIVTYIVMVGLAYPAMYLAIRGLKKTEIPKKDMGIGLYLCCFPMVYALAALSNIVGSIINARLGKLTGEGAVNPVIDLVMNVSPVILFIVAVVAAPICEELTFRKFLIDRTVGFGEKTAMIMSGLIFGLYHGNLSQFAYAFVIGMFFAFIYIRTGKVIYTILLHMFINGTTTVLSQVMKISINIDELTQYVYGGDMEAYMNYVNENLAAFALLGLMGMIIITFLLLGIVLLILNHKKFVFRPVEGQLEKGHVFSSVIINLGMIVFLIYSLSNMFIAQLGLDKNIARLVISLFRK